MTLQGQVLAGRYALGALLGAGGMGQVYRARDPVLQRTVAVKVLSPAATDDRELVARFGREARAAAALHHPNIVAVFDSGTDGDLHYLVMEYVDG
jgi:eukaryotic-like serine/threonine-protein kinase